MPTLPGKRTFLHRMGIWDVRDTVAAPVRGLQAAIVQRRFSRIVMDDKVEATWHDWPELLSNYRIVEASPGPARRRRPRTVPAIVLEPLPRQDWVGPPTPADRGPEPDSEPAAPARAHRRTVGPLALADWFRSPRPTAARTDSASPRQSRLASAAGTGCPDLLFLFYPWEFGKRTNIVPPSLLFARLWGPSGIALSAVRHRRLGHAGGGFAPMGIADLAQLQKVSDAQLSPSGKTLYFTVSRARMDLNRWQSALYASPSPRPRWPAPATGPSPPPDLPERGDKREGQDSSPRLSPTDGGLPF